MGERNLDWVLCIVRMMKGFTEKTQLKALISGVMNCDYR